jgi:hypothetical protein
MAADGKRFSEKTAKGGSLPLNGPGKLSKQSAVRSALGQHNNSLQCAILNISLNRSESWSINSLSAGIRAVQFFGF